MKKLFITMVAVIMASLFFSCEKTQEQILQEMIEARLDSTMHNPRSYEFVSMSPIDSIMSEFKDEKEAVLLELAISMNKAENKALYAKADAKYTFSYQERIGFLEQIKENNDKIDSLTAKYIDKRDSYVPHITGYYSNFKFRGQNEFGAIVLNEYKVLFNKELSEITDMQPIK